MHCCREANSHDDFLDVIVTEGFEGQWRVTKNCDEQFFTCGFKMRMDNNRVDNTAANGLTMAC